MVPNPITPDPCPRAHMAHCAVNTVGGANKLLRDELSNQMRENCWLLFHMVFC